MQRSKMSERRDGRTPAPAAAVKQRDFETRAVRAGQRRGAEGEHSAPIFATSSYVFASAAQAAARFAGDEEGNVYSRYTNPSVRLFEQRLASLEGAQAAIATASGMAAILSVCMGLLKAGDQIVCSRDVFGATRVLLGKQLARFGLETRFVPLDDLDAWRAALSPRTRLLLLETPSNPLCGVADLPALAQIARRARAWLAVDNCFCTPALQRPLEWGADIVVHSATKYLDGHGRCMGGAALGSEELMAEVTSFVRSAGPSMSPFNAWVFASGLESLSVRMAAHCERALALAQWLDGQPAVERVYYAGLPGHPGHALAARQQSGFGGVLSFALRGGQAAAWQLIDSVELLSVTANLGDVKSTIIHPATTTHGRLSVEERAASGIGDNLLRISAGLESVADLQADLAQALAKLA